jgi:hypothetical protein
LKQRPTPIPGEVIDHRYDVDAEGGMTPGMPGGGYTPGPAGPEVEHMDFPEQEITVPAPRRRIASDSVRRMINSMHEKGEITKNTWRKARRALYKPGGASKAKQIAISGRLDKWKSGRRRGQFGVTPGGYADLASGGTYVGPEE